MASTRTKYREMRIDLLGEIIKSCAKICLFYRKDLELINLPQLKKLAEEVRKLETVTKKFSAA